MQLKEMFQYALTAGPVIFAMCLSAAVAILVILAVISLTVSSCDAIFGA